MKPAIVVLLAFSLVVPEGARAAGKNRGPDRNRKEARLHPRSAPPPAADPARCSWYMDRRTWLVGGVLGTAGLALGLGYWFWPAREIPVSYEPPKDIDVFPHKEELARLVGRAKIVVNFEENHFGDNAREARLKRMKAAAEGRFGLAHEGWPADRPITLEELGLTLEDVGVRELHPKAFLRGIEEPVSSAHTGLLSYDLNFRYMNAQARDRGWDRLVFEPDVTRALLYKYFEVGGLFSHAPMQAYFEAAKKLPELSDEAGQAALKHLEQFRLPKGKSRDELKDVFLGFQPRHYFEGQRVVSAVLKQFHRDLLAGKFPQYVPTDDEREVLERYPDRFDAAMDPNFDRSVWDRILKSRRNRNFAYYIARAFVEVASRAEPMDLHVVLGNGHRPAIDRLKTLAEPHKLRLEIVTVPR